MEFPFIGVKLLIEQKKHEKLFWHDTFQMSSVDLLTGGYIYKASNKKINYSEVVN